MTMETVQIRMPKEMLDYMDKRVRQGGFTGRGEYVRHLIRKEIGRKKKRS